jgi:hypothetical protein
LSRPLPAGSGAAYQVKLLYDPATANNSGSAVPVKLQLLNAAGANESAAGITVTVAVCRARTLLMA